MANLSSKTGTITTPVQTQISLANNATTSVQDMSAYDAQEVMGFVYVDATADLRAYFTVTVVKNGAGTYEIAGADIAGDQSGTGASAIAPVSFSMSGSILQATLPNITGFASAFLRYQLSAPYLGGNYPLTVSASQVLGNAAGTAPVAGYIGQEIISTVTSVSAPAASQRGDITTILLTAGVWEVTANASLARNGATYSAAPQLLASIITAAGNSGTGEVNGYNYIFWDTCFPTTYTAVNFVFPSLRVYCDGTNITIAGTTTTGTTLRFKGFAGAYATATPQFSAMLRAVRIA